MTFHIKNIRHLKRLKFLIIIVRADPLCMKKDDYFPVCLLFCSFFFSWGESLVDAFFFRYLVPSHCMSCSKVVEQCPIGGCGQYHRREDMPTHLADKVGYHFDLLKRERTQMLWKVAKVKKITVILELIHVGELITVKSTTEAVSRDLKIQACTEPEPWQYKWSGSGSLNSRFVEVWIYSVYCGNITQVRNPNIWLTFTNYVLYQLKAGLIIYLTLQKPDTLLFRFFFPHGEKA